MAQEDGRPQKPSDQLAKFLRFIDPADPTKIMEIAVKDTGATTPDGHRIYALHVDVSEFGAKTVDEAFAASMDASVSVYSNPYELKNNQGIAVTVSCLFHAAATKGLEAWIEASPDGIIWDSTTDKFVVGLEPAFVANTRQQRTTPVDSAPKYIRFGLKNLDSAEWIADVYVHVAHIV